MTFTLDATNKSYQFETNSPYVKLTTTGTFDGAQLLAEYYDYGIGRWLIVPQGGLMTAAVTDVLFHAPSNRLRFRVHNSDGGLVDVDCVASPEATDAGFNFNS